MRISCFSQAQRHEWEQEEFATARPFNWGRPGRPLPQPRGETHSEHLARTTLPSQKLQRRPMPFGLKLATFAVVSFIGIVLAILWYGGLLR